MDKVLGGLAKKVTQGTKAVLKHMSGAVDQIRQTVPLPYLDLNYDGETSSDCESYADMCVSNCSECNIPSSLQDDQEERSSAADF